MTVAEAIGSAFDFELISNQGDFALDIRKSLKQAFVDAKPLPWPPTADDLDAYAPEDIIPKELLSFLTKLICGESDVANSEKYRIILSIAQDICRAVTNGEWKFSKHILLCTTVRHLYRSKILTTMLSRLGHCESYDFSLELETSLARAINDSTTTLTPLIVTVSHLVLQFLLMLSMMFFEQS
ncbi:uncharacterized protein LOC127865978 [Dreissena polymorpha]|uniref:uncharacterized protein LOC127865978 n=1 Tax=Dreissena polymorpha TaxID=45954 RepID=UPI0022650BD3|nr:uncharacterized protein LOC127865978 [Dreissena polymorpha]